MRKIFIILCISYLAHISVHADTSTCETKTWYELYECRVEKVCEPYKNPKPVSNSEEYKENLEEYKENSQYLNPLDTKENWAYIVLEEVKWTYRDNIWKIYSCAMIQTQLNTLKNLIEKNLLKFNKNWDLEDVIWERIRIRERKLDTAANKLECKGTDNQIIYNKQNILRETTHEVCKYNIYLEYLKEHYSSIPNILGIDTNDPTDNNNNGIADVKEDTNNDGVADVEEVIKVYSTSEISRLILGVEDAINQEIDHTYKVFPIAFQAYTEYENHYPLHFLLEIIREDFVLFRRSLHQALMPIAQVGYKIINAMIK